MKEFFIIDGVVLLTLMIPILFRIVQGPTVIDRMMGANIIGAKTTVMLILIGTLYHRLDMFVDLALTYALLNYMGSLASARFIQRRKTTTAEPEPETDETSMEMKP